MRVSKQGQINLLGFVPLFILAGALSLAYLHTSSILVPMVMHALFNATSLTILFFATRAG